MTGMIPAGRRGVSPMANLAKNYGADLAKNRTRGARPEGKKPSVKNTLGKDPIEFAREALVKQVGKLKQRMAEKDTTKADVMQQLDELELALANGTPIGQDLLDVLADMFDYTDEELAGLQKGLTAVRKDSLMASERIIDIIENAGLKLRDKETFFQRGLVKVGKTVINVPFVYAMLMLLKDSIKHIDSMGKTNDLAIITVAVEAGVSVIPNSTEVPAPNCKFYKLTAKANVSPLFVQHKNATGVVTMLPVIRVHSTPVDEKKRSEFVTYVELLEASVTNIAGTVAFVQPVIQQHLQLNLQALKAVAVILSGNMKMKFLTPVMTAAALELFNKQTLFGLSPFGFDTISSIAKSVSTEDSLSVLKAAGFATATNDTLSTN